MKLSQRLFNELKHGDQEHQDWLENKIDAFFKAEKKRIIAYIEKGGYIKVSGDAYLFLSLAVDHGYGKLVANQSESEI